MLQPTVHGNRTASVAIVLLVFSTIEIYLFIKRCVLCRLDIFCTFVIVYFIFIGNYNIIVF